MDAAVTLITKESLGRALAARVGMSSQDADESAEHLLDLFGFHDEIIDNVLEPGDRVLFYALQEAGLLTTRCEETDLWNGQSWRTHSWLVRTDRVLAAAHLAESAGTAGVAGGERDVYADLPAECWARR